MRSLERRFEAALRLVPSSRERAASSTARAADAARPGLGRRGARLELGDTTGRSRSLTRCSRSTWSATPDASASSGRDYVRDAWRQPVGGVVATGARTGRGRGPMLLPSRGRSGSEALTS